MDAVQLLLNDHRTVESLFQRFEQSTPGDSELRRELVEQMIRELSIHASIEEQVLYPEARRALAEGEEKVDEGLEEHQEAKEALSELDGKDPADLDFDAMVRSLIRDVRHHVEEEEGDLLPKLRDSIPSERLDEMGETMERLKALAPTRPHPRAPSRPPANIVAGGVAAVMDRARDAVTGRRGRAGATAKRTTAKKATGGRKKASTGPKKTTARKQTAARKKTTTRKKTTARTATTRGKTSTSRAKKTTTRKTAARASARRAEYHVVPDGGGWKAEKKGATRAMARGDRKAEVVRKARDAARRQKGQLVIHNARGRIQEERTYGPDPRRTKG